MRDFAREIGATPTDTRGAVEGAEAIVLSIPLPALAELPEDFFDGVPASVPIIDTSNYYPGIRDPKIDDLEAGKVESVWVSEQIGRPIIKAFNNILAESLANKAAPKGSRERLAIAVAGDDGDTKRVAMEIVDIMGFDPVDTGSLANSWRHQPAAPGYCCDYSAEMVLKGVAQANEAERIRARGLIFERLMTFDREVMPSDLPALNREYNGVA